MQTELAPRATIAQLVGIRDRALKRYEALLSEAHAINELVKPLNEESYRRPQIQLTLERGRLYNSADIEDFRKKLDAAAWDHLMVKTELRDLMGASQKKQLRDQLQDDTPEFTLETAVATFEDKRKRSGEIFRQGLVDVFEALPRDFRSHDGFKIGSRCVMTYAVTWWGDRASWQHSYFEYRRDQFGDLDRAFHALAHKEWTSNAADFAAAAMAAGKTEVETDFFKIRWFRNGNVHVWFTDKETTKKANKLLAEHYGAKLGKMHLHPDHRKM